MNLKSYVLWLFGKPIKQTQQIPGCGEAWILKQCNDPWGGRPEAVVKIVDVKEGWVRYDFPNLFKDQRMRMEMFLFCYEKMGES